MNLRSLRILITALALLGLSAGAVQAARLVTALPAGSGLDTPTPTTTGTETATPEASPTPLATFTPEPKDHESEFSGVVSAINAGSWTIGGQTVTVDERTEIEGNPQVGDTVKVEAVQQADGSWLATSIEKKQPRPTQSATPQVSKTPGSDDDHDDDHPQMTRTPGDHEDEDEHEDGGHSSQSGQGSRHSGGGGKHKSSGGHDD